MPVEPSVTVRIGFATKASLVRVLYRGVIVELIINKRWAFGVMLSPNHGE